MKLQKVVFSVAGFGIPFFLINNDLASFGCKKSIAQNKIPDLLVFFLGAEKENH